MYSKAILKIHNQMRLEMYLGGMDWCQQLYQIDKLRRILPTLHLRKKAHEPVWMMRIGKRWINHTSIELV